MLSKRYKNLGGRRKRSVRKYSFYKRNCRSLKGGMYNFVSSFISPKHKTSTAQDAGFHGSVFDYQPCVDHATTNGIFDNKLYDNCIRNKQYPQWDVLSIVAKKLVVDNQWDKLDDNRKQLFIRAFDDDERAYLLSGGKYKSINPLWWSNLDHAQKMLFVSSWINDGRVSYGNGDSERNFLSNLRGADALKNPVLWNKMTLDKKKQYINEHQFVGHHYIFSDDGKTGNFEPVWFKSLSPLQQENLSRLNPVTDLSRIQWLSCPNGAEDLKNINDLEFNYMRGALGH